MTGVLTLMAMLTLDGKGEVVDHVALPPPRAYRLRKMTASGDEPFCVSILEQRPPPLQARALALGCFQNGTHAFVFHEPRVAGDWHREYTIVAWPPSERTSPTTVIVKTEIDKETL